jgi:hypothetical protein
MSALGPTASTRPTILHLAGDLDLYSLDVLEARFEDAFGRGHPVVVDFGECTLATVDVLRYLDEAGHRAGELGLGFVVVLPYSASGTVRRLVLELAPELAEFSIAPSVRTATAFLERPPASRPAKRVEDERLRALRASIWETASRLEALLATRDELLLEKRRTLEQVRARRAASA